MVLVVVLVVCAVCDFLLSLALAMVGDKSTPGARRYAACMSVCLSVCLTHDFQPM